LYLIPELPGYVAPADLTTSPPPSQKNYWATDTSQSSRTWLLLAVWFQFTEAHRRWGGIAQSRSCWITRG